MLKKDAIEYFGKPIALAKALGITSGSISQWGSVIPEKQALRLFHLTNGALKYDPSLYSRQPARQYAK